MNQIQYINVDVGNPSPLNLIHEKQGDSGRYIYVSLFDYGVSYSVPTGSIPVVRFLKPDGNAVVYDGNALKVKAETTLESVSVNENSFIQIHPTAGTYLFTYNGSVWKLNNVTEDISVSGITYTGTPENGDTITVTSSMLNAIVVSGNTLQILLIDQCLTADGKAICDVGLFNTNGERITSFIFNVEIEKSAVADQTIVSSSYFNVLTASISEGIAVLANLPSGGQPGMTLTKTETGTMWANGSKPGIGSVSIPTGSWGVVPTATTETSGASVDVAIFSQRVSTEKDYTWTFNGTYWVSEFPAIPSTAQNTSIAECTVNVNASIFTEKVTNAGTYTYTYDGRNWKDSQNNTIDLAEYGISLDTQTPLAAADYIIIVLSFSYQPLSYYGITYTGTPSTGDTIVVTYGHVEDVSRKQVTITGATTRYSKVDLQPTYKQIQQLMDDGTNAFYIENDSNVFYAVVVGEVPSVAMTIQAQITEVNG